MQSRQADAPEFPTLVDLLRHRAAESPNTRAYVYLADGENDEVPITNAGLDAKARAIAAALQALGAEGKRAVLIYPPDLDYLAAFFGCLYAGVVAVPAYPPDPTRLNRTLPRLQAMIADAGADIVMTTSAIHGMARFLFDHAPDLENKKWLSTDELTDVSAWSAPSVGPETLAFLQYTSGSTGAPKGVMLTHGNLLANLVLISNAFEIDDTSIGVSWLPPYHDMGLIGGILAPLYKGRTTALMSPIAFLQRPLRWLRAITKFKATISGGPNFAYDLCIRKTTSEDRRDLDLSSWTLAFSGAEPVRQDTLERFVEIFGPCGFRRASFYPCYGLAEATLIVSGGDRRAEPVVRALDAEALGRNVAADPTPGRASATLVGCGATLGTQTIAIVHPDSGAPCLPGEIGEIWVRGASVAQGYWQRAAESEQTFRARLAGSGAGPFLRTGDLGFLRDGELYVTGRLKDLVIIRGVNHYPQDIERTVDGAHPAIRRGCAAAFSVEVEDDERLVIAVEVERRWHERRRTSSRPPGADDRRGPDRRKENLPPGFDPDQPQPFVSEHVAQAIRKAVLDHHDLRVHAVVLLKPGTLPKTSSGKTQRRATRDGYLTRTLEEIARSEEEVSPESSNPSSGPLSVEGVVSEALSVRRIDRVPRVTAYLREQIARVLRVDPAAVDPDAPLDTLGLDSLMAVELAHELEKSLGAIVPVTSFLRDTTIAAIARTVVTRLANAEPQAIEQVDTGEPEFPLSPGQKALWLLHRMAPESAAYNMSCAIRIVADRGRPAPLRTALQLLASRHPMLRSRYFLRDEELVQRIEDGEALAYEVFDASALDDESLALRVEACAAEPFDLERGPVLRARVFQRNEGDAVLVLSAHHVAADFWSLVLLLSELRALLPALQQGTIPELAPIELGYRDYVRWCEDIVQRTSAEHLAYWERQLSGELPVLALPLDRRRPPTQTFRGASVAIGLGPDRVAGLRLLAKSEKTTLYTVLLSAFYTLLGRLSGQEDIIIGAPLAGRSRAGFDRVVGYFVNPLPLRGDLRGDPTFRELVRRVREVVLDALEHQDLPFPQLVERLQPVRDPSRSPIFQVAFVLEKSHLAEDQDLPALGLGVPGAKIDLDGTRLESWPLRHGSAPFDVSLMITEGADHLAGWLQYNPDLFDESTVVRAAQAFGVLLDGIVAAPDTRLSDVPLVDDAEHRRLLALGTGAATAAVAESAVDAFVDASRRHADAVALQMEGDATTFADLERRSGVLARALRRRGVGRGAIVAIWGERSTDTIVSMLAALRAGAAYLPLDPRNPPPRLAAILEDARPALLLATRRHAAALPPGIATLLVDSEWEHLEEEARAIALPHVSADDAAYVIFTSGSTGRPKGVVVPHRGLVCFADALMHVAELGPGERVLQFASSGFDASVLEIFPALFSGATLVLTAPERTAPGEPLVACLREQNVTFSLLPPSMLAAMSSEPLPELRVLAVGGEACSADVVARWGTGRRLLNLYGPTECSVAVTAAICADDGRAPPVGRPLGRSCVRVLDRAFGLAPVGGVGEIVASGPQVAWGYLGSPERTAAAFVPDPHATTPGARAYRTGDRGRLRDDGQIEFFGRNDAQLKIRGHRIEPGEIEAALLAEPSVAGAVVVARETDGSRELVAYVVPSGAQPSAVGLREGLRSKLPDYMIPSHFVVLESFPLTSAGKVDRAALPAPVQHRHAFVAPRNALDEVLTLIWAEVLGVPQVGIHDDFFALGGHSLLAMRIAARAHDLIGLELPLRALFDCPTVAGVTDRLLASPEHASALERAEILVQIASLSDEEAARMMEDGRIPTLVSEPTKS